jgi:hypothetical protein
VPGGQGEGAVLGGGQRGRRQGVERVPAGGEVGRAADHAGGPPVGVAVAADRLERVGVGEQVEGCQPLVAADAREVHRPAP